MKTLGGCPTAGGRQPPGVLLLLPVYLCGHLHPKTIVWALVVVEGYVPAQALACLCNVPVPLLPIYDLGLYRSVDTLGYGIVRRLVVFSHADADIVPVQLTNICITAVLYPPVRVVYKSLKVVPASLLYCHAQGP